MLSIAHRRGAVTRTVCADAAPPSTLRVMARGGEVAAGPRAWGDLGAARRRWARRRAIPRAMAPRSSLLLLLLSSLGGAARADEGLWTLDAVPRDLLRQRHGFAPDDAWLERARLGAPRLDGCSSSFLSPEGLIMTNAHCVRHCQQDLSTPQSDLVTAGFYAAERAAERRCAGERLDQLVAIEDVSARVQQATAGLSGDRFAAALRAEKARLERSCQAPGPGQSDGAARCELVSLYRGGLYHLYRYRRYDDVRLVFAPEDGAAFFGGDPDNYEFPRWNLDVAFLRAYEGGRPARTPQHLRLSRSGAREGDLVLLLGSPGRTERLMTTAQLESERDVALPDALAHLSELRGMLREFQRRGPEARRVATTKLYGVENNLKRVRGQLALLSDRRFFSARAEAERRLRQEVAQAAEAPGAGRDKDPSLRAAAGAWDEIAAAVEAFRPHRAAYLHLEGGRGLDSRLFRFARTLVRGAKERGRPSELRLKEFQDAALPELAQDLLGEVPIDDELEIATLGHGLHKLREALGADDPRVRRVLGAETPHDLAARVVRGCALRSAAARKALWEGGAAALSASPDAMLKLAALVDEDARAARRRYEDGYDAALQRAGERIARARFALHGRSVYPDGTGTLRLSFGLVSGYEQDGRRVGPFTSLGGLFARATGQAPFALPPRWLAARPRLDGKLPFNGVSTADSSGGNSGSPVLNRAGEIVGINFDQNRFGTASPFSYDEARRRQVFLTSPALLHALEVVYGAAPLLKELRGN